MYRFGEFVKIGEFCLIFTETPNMSEPNAELAVQYEKEDAERKAEIAARKSGGGRGGGAGNGGGGNKTWGSSGGQGPAAAGQAGGDPRKRGGSKEKR